ncbi:conserved phage C-terminal domain-containing protein [Neobacillus kokaensis]|uniref:Phage conserved hypothetical protein C-terminal domain-containing protein n=1 Tax=Neobacillus kokaensis TaxID=2759023 RepID=A0ABQ3N7R3_9BACI|nr:conserved phage C-terminal domain-containing protein [Neobacillus kokaensis]GHI00072.1 hypothetical protein AM1BK_36140 [Neobacillus kokaensis]
MSTLVVNESPVMVIPSLAVKLGLNEAIVLQQIHYWLVRSKHVIEGKRWVYNTYHDWQKQLPFWSESTIKRTIRSLESLGYLQSGNWNRLKLDKTKWYTINYDKLPELEAPMVEEDQPMDEASSEQTDQSNMAEDDCAIQGNLEEAVDRYPESGHQNPSIPYLEIIQYLNERAKSAFKADNRKTKNLIRARWKEGFRLADFKRVIDLKTAEWLRDPMFAQYLRPKTLFGTNFESYLNQKWSSKRLLEEDFNLDD